MGKNPKYISKSSINKQYRKFHHDAQVTLQMYLDRCEKEMLSKSVPENLSEEELEEWYETFQLIFDHWEEEWKIYVKGQNNKYYHKAKKTGILSYKEFKLDHTAFKTYMDIRLDAINSILTKSNQHGKNKEESQPQGEDGKEKSSAKKPRRKG